MQEFLKKLCKVLGIEGNAEDLTEEAAVNLIESHIKQLETNAGRRQQAEADERTRKQLHISDETFHRYNPRAYAKKGLSDAEIIAALDRIEEDKAIDLIETAMQPGPGDWQGKLAPDDREFAMQTFREIGLDGLRAFVKHRPKHPYHLYPTAYRALNKKKAVELSAVEDETRRKLGVSREAFLKYNTPETGLDDELEDKIRRQIGVSKETYLKYNPPGGKTKGK